MKKIQTFTIDQTARLCMHLMQDTPCTFHDVVDNKGDKWCAKHCKYPATGKDMLKCWKHAIKKGWFK